jgi:hypothetical protein
MTSTPSGGTRDKLGELNYEDSQDGDAKSSSLDEDDLINPESLGFAHLDDVCIKLLKKGKPDDAIKYLARMRTMIDTIVTKLEPSGESKARPDSTPLPMKPKAPKPRGSNSQRGPRSARTGQFGSARKTATEPDTQSDAGSERVLPVIVRAPPDPIDTAAERLAAKDAHIASLKAQLAAFEEVVDKKEAAVKAEKAKAKEASKFLKKREEQIQTVRARPGRLSGLSVFHSKSSLYGGFLWVHRALDCQKRLFPARADEAAGVPRGAGARGGPGGREHAAGAAADGQGERAGAGGGAYSSAL